MLKDSWRGDLERLERWLSGRRAQLIVLSVLLVVFVSYRWFQRLEPWNSDDMTLFERSSEAARGQHWLFGTQGLSAETHEAEPLSHQALRLGLLPVSMPLLAVFGASSTVYYLVPLLFSVIGFVAIYWLLRENFGALTALVFGVIHVAWPFELSHSSVFLVDLPAAAMALVSLCLLDAGGRRQRSAHRLVVATLAGLCALEGYLLRSNTLVLLAPAYLVFLRNRATRTLTLWVGLVLMLGVFGEQMLLEYRGYGWGYRWAQVRSALNGYSEFLPIYSWQGFITRPFMFHLNKFHHGLSGALAALLLVGSLVGHALVLRFERRALLVSVVVFGGFAWLVFTFSIYELVDGGVRAMGPPSFRYTQPFIFSSLVVWAWLWQRSRRWVPVPAMAALPLSLATFSYVASAKHLPVRYRGSETQALATAVRALNARGDGPLSVAGTEASVRVLRMFCGDSSRVEWHVLTPEELATESEQRRYTAVLRDVRRELSRARYFDEAQRSSYRSTLARLDSALWRNYTIEYLDGIHALFALQPSGAAPAAGLKPANTTPSKQTLPTPHSSPAPLNRQPCQVSVNDSAQVQVIELAPAARGRTFCEYSWDATAHWTPETAKAAGDGLVAVVSVDYEYPLTASASVVQETGQTGARFVRGPQFSVPPGTSYLPVELDEGARSVSVVYTLTALNPAGPQAMTLHPVEWRPHTAQGAPGHSGQ